MSIGVIPVLISLIGHNTGQSMRFRNLGWILALAITSGCQKDQASSPVAQKSEKDPVKAVAKAPAFDETKGYLHKASGVGFVYPSGWQHHDADGPETDTSLGLYQPGAAIVTMFWTEIPDAPSDFADQIGQLKYNDYKAMYHDNVKAPKAITIGGQPGFEISMNTGPGGDDSIDAVGADYLFAVRRGNRVWSIELRASAKDVKTLASIRSLLSNYKVLPQASNP